ncbi:hypothetical protein N7513_003470 [Penicillium frequentans]|uniref:Uncharacterized protein n=1 Tax=Penicillium frequentans TaxID=3151616 RepID=A0AAD6CXN7_9EURO|nr:hypothetical protein N7494_005219 [Penicillium glabrum]KAJ5557884.1 hypothetical protein N7513_003470 [Penicillium glabrum]
MQLLSSLAAFADLALAQNAAIGLPTPNQTVAPGSNIIVQIQRPICQPLNSLTGSTEMAVAIGLVSCLHQVCQPASNIMGSIVYNGLFDPAYHETYLPPYQNFTVTVPFAFAAGQAQVNVAHATLLGAGPYPDLESLNQTIVIS